MIRLLSITLPLIFLSLLHSDDTPKPSSPTVMASGLTTPTAVTVSEDGAIYFASLQGGIHTLRDGKPQPFAMPETQIQHVVAWKNLLYACDYHNLWAIDASGKSKTLVGETQFTELAKDSITLAQFTIDDKGNLFVIANQTGGPGCIFKVPPKGIPTLEFTPGSLPELHHLSAVCVAGESAIMVQRHNQPEALLLCLIKHRVIASVPLCSGSALDYDSFGRLYACSNQTQQVMVLPRPGAAKSSFPRKFQKLGSLAVDHPRHRLLVTDSQAGTIASLPLGDPAHPIDESPLPFTVQPAFPKIKWTGWEPISDKGIPIPHRPIDLTHANDGSHRTFVATQQGVIHVLPNRPDVEQTKVFLDIQNKVTYSDTSNEEGLLGLTFHPRYKENGEFFVFYSPKTGKVPSLATVVSRFKVSKDDPDKADPNSEEILLTFKRPYWNHDGGTLCFGPDGYLYLCIGDGGAANDPKENGQKLDTIFASILRIDVDRKDPGKAYAIPPDNPFVGNPKAAPEKFIYGVRNPWRMTFDRKTGQGWFADVGQNLYEEINLLRKGGNYGWNPRESFHPFGAKAVDVNQAMIEPIWEYHHRIGKSITGGPVYRGKLFPELEGMYLYADYVSAKIWALRYDFDLRRVTAHREIANRNLPILSFGEDEDGEVYLLTFSARGQGIDRLVRKK